MVSKNKQQKIVSNSNTSTATHQMYMFKRRYS